MRTPVLALSLSALALVAVAGFTATAQAQLPQTKASAAKPGKAPVKPSKPPIKAPTTPPSPRASLPAVAPGPLPTSSPTVGSALFSLAGGFQTNPVDQGRPVVLIAAALGVPEAVFRAAFTGVTPAAGGHEPDSAQVQLNKAALLKALAPYGVTNAQLDEVSNFYRYSGVNGQTWPHRAAQVTAVVTNGIVTGFTIVNGGSGYTSLPVLTLTDGRTVTATVSYGTTLTTNGSLTALTVK